MKKIISVILCFTLLFSLAACSSGNSESNESTTPATETPAQNVSDNAENTTEGKKILVIYFSSANTNDADIVSGATSKVGSASSTEYLANYIHKHVGGDIEKIIPVKDYPESYNDTADKAKSERDNDERPEFKTLSVNPEDYDIIFVGYPMWWYTLPMIMYTFFDTYDFNGKTIIPFNTHEGSGDSGTYEEIKSFEPNATVLDGFNVRGNNAGKADSDLDKWLENLGY